AGGVRTRLIHIKKENKGNQASQPSQASRDEQDVHYANDLAVDDSRDATQNHNGSVPNTLPVNPLKNKAWDARDARDAKIPPFSFCVHCRRPGGAECSYDGIVVWLHSGCLRSWIDAYEASRLCPPQPVNSGSGE